MTHIPRAPGLAEELARINSDEIHYAPGVSDELKRRIAWRCWLIGLMMGAGLCWYFKPVEEVEQNQSVNVDIWKHRGETFSVRIGEWGQVENPHYMVPGECIPFVTPRPIYPSIGAAEE